MDPNQPSPVTAPVTPARAPELSRQPEKLLPAAHGGDSWGAFIGIVIIIIVLVVGALYFWGERLVGTPATETPAAFQPAESASSEIADIESDLSGTDLQNLDTELNSINTELGI